VSEVILELDAVVKRFGDNEVLRGISLNLHRHEVVCLIGASGSGKSTLLRCVNLLETIDGGTITLFGQSLTESGSIPTGSVATPAWSFSRSTSFRTQCSRERPRGTGASAEAQAQRRTGRALQLLERIGLRDRADEYPERLSGGQQQRVAIVRSLAMRPALLLLDEVTSALDPSLVGEVLDLLRDLAHTGTTMLIATHEMNFARDVAQKIVYLDGGVLVEQGTPEQIFSNPQHESTRLFLERVR